MTDIVNDFIYHVILDTLPLNTIYNGLISRIIIGFAMAHLWTQRLRIFLKINFIGRIQP